MRASTFSKEEAMARYVSLALSVVRRRGNAAAEAHAKSPARPRVSVETATSVGDDGSRGIGEEDGGGNGDELPNDKKNGWISEVVSKRNAEAEAEIARLSARTKKLEG